MAKPFYQSGIFTGAAIALAIAGIALFTLYKLERERKTMFQQQMLAVTALPLQKYTIDPHKDTVLVSMKGAKLTIPAEAIVSSENKPVVLILKEAYTMEDIVMAGLTTKSGSELLSSGGMIYIQPEDPLHVRMQKPVSLSIPAEQVNTRMSAYKGSDDADGNIDWTEPQPVKNASDPKIAEGESLFKENCVSCHKIGQESIGPDLAHISKLRKPEWIREFVRNNAKLRASGDRDAICVYERFNKSEMTAFPFNNDKIDKMVSYIQKESDEKQLPIPEYAVCAQKCEAYMKLISTLQTRKYELQNTRRSKITDNGNFVKEVEALRTSLQLPVRSAGLTSQQPALVEGMNRQAEYYQIEINTFGWYNIDILMKKLPGLVESVLKVTVDEQYKDRFSLYLMIPSLKMNATGGPLKDQQNTYGFYEESGTISLPQNASAIVYLIGEQNGQLLYASAVFQTMLNKEIELKPELISKEEFNTRIKALITFDGISIGAKNAKNATAIRRIDTDLKALDAELIDAEKLKPTECDCNCGLTEEDDRTVK